MSRPTVIVITGPTASGKSALAAGIAWELGGEVISADSRQLYRDIPIVTAAPSKEEMMGVRHHLIGVLGLEETYSAARFAEDASSIIRRLHSEGKPAVVCGGSMLYVNTLTSGIDELPEVPAELRRKLTEEWKLYGDARLRLRLLGLDPEYYSRVDLENMKRVFHGVEVSLAAGRPYSSYLKKSETKGEGEFDFITFIPDWPREALFGRINRRVEVMMEQGLLEEAKRVYPLRGLNSLNTVGLKELFDHFDGKMDLETAISRIQKNTRVYAKKQMTWYKKDAGMIHVDASKPDMLARVLSEITLRIRSHSRW